MKPQIVIDTNVLVTALKSSQGASYKLLSMVETGAFQLHISTPLVAEYEAVLKRGLLTLSDAQIDDVLDFICARAQSHKIYYLWRPVLKDPGDDFLLELAVKANARIITWNVADFKRAQPMGMQVQTPREFLLFLKGKQS